MAAARNTAMDVVRGGCILLVFMFHAMPAIETYYGLEPTAPVSAFNFFFQPYRMTLLMFLSGMLLHRSLDKAPRIFVEGKLASIFLPFLLWSVLILIAEGRADLITIAKVPISSPTVLWYLWFLFAFYLLALVLHRARISFPIVIVVTLLASLVLPEFLRMSRFAYLFGFFLLGHVMASRMEMIPRSRWFAAGMLAIVLVGGVISGSGYKINYNTFYVIFPFALVALVLWAMPLYRATTLSRGIEWVGRNSIVFYVVHFPVQVLLAQALATRFEPGTIGYGWIYAATALMPLLVGGILTWARGRSQVVAALFDFRVWRRVFAGRGRAAQSAE